MSPSPPPTTADHRREFRLAAAGVVLLVLAAYHNSFSVPFVFDDVPAILENPSIRSLWPLGGVLFPKIDGGVTVSGRPLVNLSLAINHALGGQGVWGYHAFNLLVHLSAGLVLFGIIRRTFAQPALATRFGPAARPLGLTVAALWLLHPMQTESVTYIVQRAESLVGLFCLLTIYGFIRATERAEDRPETAPLSAAAAPVFVPAVAGQRNLKTERETPANFWLGVSLASCLLGMASKEVMVSAPLLVLLYDRTFVTETFREAWHRRWRYYLGLASTWLLLACLVVGTTGRGGTAGFATNVSSWHYLLTQCRAVVHYLWLSVWPHPLVFDYGTATVGQLADVWPQALLLLALATGTVVALVRRPVWGFVGAWFFLILAPSSSVVPVASQTMAEHRMYLPLAAVIVVLVTGLHAWLGRRGFLVWGALAVAGGGLTMLRNADYRTDAALWADTVARQPANGRAHNNLGKAVFVAGRPAEALAHYEKAIRLQPGVPEPHYNLGLALARLNRSAEAIPRYEEALRLQPDYPEAHNNLGNARLATGRPVEALEHYETAVRLRPGFAEAHSNLANLLPEVGRGPEAIVHGEEAVRLAPANAEARRNLGNALASAGRFAAAQSEYETALRLKPDDADVANNLGNVLAEIGRLPEAITAYHRALQLNPGQADSRRNLTQVLIHLGRRPEAIAEYQRLLQLRPGDQDLRAELTQLQTMGPP